jgi:hypothetical protein
MKQGLVRRIQCFKFSKEHSAYVTHLLYAHRQRSSLIVQEIDIMNPSEHTLDLDLQQSRQISKTDFKQLDQQDVQFDSTKEIFLMTTNQISTRQNNFIIFVLITNKIISNSHIKPGGYVQKESIWLFILFIEFLFLILAKKNKQF